VELKEFLERLVPEVIQAIFEKSISIDQFINMIGFFEFNIKIG